MTVRAFASVAAEADFVEQSTQRFRQLNAIAQDENSREIAMSVAAHYRKYPWTTPGLAVAFGKWKKDYGKGAAKALARVAYDDPDQLEKFAMSKEFQRQVKQKNDGGGSWIGGLTDAIIGATPVVGPAYTAGKEITGKSVGDVLAPIHEKELEVAKAVPGVKPVARGVFTALESPYQEVQGMASRAATGLLGAFGAAAQGAQGNAPANPTESLQSARQFGAESTGALEDLGIHSNPTAPFELVSTGAIALEQAAAGKPVDLGTGYFPGGEVQQEHVRRVQDIGYFNYDGERHYATPGRIVSSFVTEPGTLPFQALSGMVDAAMIVKADPINPALSAIGDVNRARQGFDMARELEAAGGLRNSWRTFTHGPTVTQWLDSNKGAKVLDAFANERDFLHLARATNWKLPAKTMAAIVEAEDPSTVRQVLEPLLGGVVREQPTPYALGAHFRHTTQPLRIANVRPENVIDVKMLDGDGGALSNVYRWMKNAKVPDEKISPVLQQLAGARGAPGQYEGLKVGAAVVEETLTHRGVPKNVAHDVTRMFTNDLEEGSKYWINQIADDTTTPSLLIDGRSYPTDKPHLYVEHLNSQVWLPSATDVDKTLAKYGRIFGIKGTGATEVAARGSEAGVRAGEALLKSRYAPYMGNAFLTHVQSAVWVPLTLLRGAWTVRVVGEEQLRMGASELSSFFHHPLSHIVEVTGRKGGLVDRDLMDTSQMQAALSRDSGKFVGDAGQRIVAKGKRVLNPGQTDYERSWADELVKQHSDPLSSEVARAVHAGAPEASMAARVGTPEQRALDALADVKARFWDGDLRGLRADLEEGKLANELATREGADAYIDTLNQRMHDMTAGHGPLVEYLATGRYGDPQTLKAALRDHDVRSLDDGLEGFVTSHRPGSRTAKVMWNGAEHPVPVSVDEIELVDSSARKALNRAHDGVNTDPEFVNFLKGMPDEVKPGRVVGDVLSRDPKDTWALDKGVQHLFSLLMARPTNYLSRSPAFRQFYWKRIEELMPQADQATQSLIVQAAERTGQSRTVRKGLSRIAENGGAGELGLEEIDDLAKGFGLDSTRELLYDLNRRSQFFDATRLLFPFGEAWKEVLTRWAKIGVERPKTLRQAQIGINGLRGANPLELLPGAVPEQYQNQGFFFKDETTGEESYGIPWSQKISEKLIGVPIPFVGSAKGLNMAFNLLPGVGLAAQIPASAFLNRYMSDPKWDPIREMIAPYGQPDLTAGLEGFAPAWMKKWLTGSDIGGEEDARMLNNTVMQVFAYGVSTGEYKANSAEHIQSGMRDAESKARELYRLRGTLQFVAPSVPSPRFLIEAKDGKLVQLTVLRDAFHKLQEKDYDTAVAKFIDRFGEKAFYATGPQTQSNAYAIPVTDEGLDWTRKNPAVREKFPTTYGFFAPAGGEFDYNAYLRSLATGEREPVDPTEWAKRSNNVLGSIWYDRAREKMGLTKGDTGSDKQRAFLADLRDLIRDEYPGWRDLEGGIGSTRVPHAIEELAKASKNPTLRKQQPGLTESIRLYEQARQTAIAAVEKLGGTSEFGRPGFGEGAKYSKIRGYLNTVAATIMKAHPEFEAVFEQVYSRELPEDEG